MAILVISILTAVLLSACEPTSMSSGGPSIDTSKPVPVALLVPIGSNQPGDSVLARSLENSARLAMADLQGVTIDLRVYDTAGNADIAGNVAAQAVNDGARIILGPVYAASANAAGLAVRSSGVNVISFSNNPTIAGGNVFVLGPTFSNTANRLAQFAARQGKGKMVIIHGTDIAGQSGHNAIQQAIGGTGGHTCRLSCL